MAHDWMIGVLSDLADYARKNGLDSTAKASEALLHVAQAEIADNRVTQDEQDVLPPHLRRN